MNVVKEETDDADWEGAPVTRVVTQEENAEQPIREEKVHIKQERALTSRSWARFSKALKCFEARKAIFQSSVQSLKSIKEHGFETSDER